LSSNLSRRVLLNVPSPNPERSTYARFIPREELGDFANWSPDSFSGEAPRTAANTEPAPPPAAAEPTLADWEARLDAVRQEAYQDGYRDGLVALEGFKKSHVEQVNAHATRVLQTLDAEFDALHGQLAESVTQVAVQLARQVLRTELQTAPEHIAHVAAEAVEAVLLNARHITVHLHPHDLPLVGAGAQEVLQARGARLVSSPSIERGGCRVESNVGAIDARIAVRWAQAAGALGSTEPWHEDGAEAGSESST
jgi:flagellar assembly protein FliH